MSDLEPPSGPLQTPALPAILPLSARSVKGSIYVRRQEIETEIAHVMSTDSSQWDLAGLRSETIVYLIRRGCPNGDETVLARLLDTLARRVTRLASRWAGGFDQTTTEEIVWMVGLEIMELVLSPETTPQCEFLECMFDLGVKRRVIKQSAKRIHLRRNRQFGVHAADNDDSATCGAQTIADDSPSQTDLVDQAELRSLAPAQIKKALAAIGNPNHRLAVVLHFLHGWPITDKDAGRETVSRLFGVSDRTIRNWFRTALEEMRHALGANHE